MDRVRRRTNVGMGGEHLASTTPRFRRPLQNTHRGSCCSARVGKRRAVVAKKKMTGLSGYLGSWLVHRVSGAHYCCTTGAPHYRIAHAATATHTPARNAGKHLCTPWSCYVRPYRASITFTVSGVRVSAAAESSMPYLPGYDTGRWGTFIEQFRGFAAAPSPALCHSRLAMGFSP